MQCGFCSMLSELFSRVTCFGNRRSSTHSHYKELGDQDTLKTEDKVSDSEETIENGGSMKETPEVEVERTDCEMYDGLDRSGKCTGRFLTIHKRRKKRLLTRSLLQDRGLLEDLHYTTVECVLSQSALWNFNAFALDNVCGGRSLQIFCVHLFEHYGLITHFELDPVRLWKLFTLIEEGYHSSNPYHNHVHAVDVTQAMHCFLQQDQIREHMEPLEIMASLIASIAHDVDHPGVNQPFLIATSNHLASLYKNTSVLENHHWRWALSCLSESGLVDHIPDAMAALGAQISSLIRATDITRQQEFLGCFKDHLDKNTMNLERPEHRHLTLQIALKCADISNPCRVWDISRKWSLKVCEEFFRQGDYERKLNLPISELCNRDTTSIPKIQSGFFQFVVTPLMTQWHRFLQNDLSQQMLENLQYNKSMWEQLIAKEIAEETKIEISEADVVEEDLESCTLSNISSSSELLIPRRCSLNVTKQPLCDRRLSVPLNMRQDVKFKDKHSRKSSAASYKAYREELDSEHSLHSRQSWTGGCEPEDEKEKVLSTEKLLPDSSIASITTPVQATRLNSVFGKSGKLLRQQTFPPVEVRVAIRGNSHDEESHKTDISQTFSRYGINIFSKIFAKSENDKTDNENASDVSQSTFIRGQEKENLDPMEMTRTGRRESAPVGSQLRGYMAATQATPFTKEQLLLRRKSMPTDVQSAPKEKKARDSLGLPQLLSRTSSGREYGYRRRGSAPVDMKDIRALVGSAIRHSLNGAGRRKQKELQPIGGTNH